MATDYEKLYNELRQQVEHDRWLEQERSEAAYQQRIQERKRRQREWQERQFMAQNWPDGFHKAINRLKAEIEQDQGEGIGSVSSFLSKELQTTMRAYELWQEEERAIRGRIRRVRQRTESLIEAIEQGSRERVANQIETEAGDSLVIEALQKNNPQMLLDW